MSSQWLQAIYLRNYRKRVREQAEVSGVEERNAALTAAERCRAYRKRKREAETEAANLDAVVPPSSQEAGPSRIVLCPSNGMAGELNTEAI